MKRVTIVLLVFLWGMLMGWIALVAGCQTVKGMAGDSAWILQKTADNIQLE